MTCYTAKLTYDGVISPPKWLPHNIQYETVMGSTAYGVAQDNSDIDIYGFAIPTKELVFPHLAGEIYGFGRQLQRFEQYQQHHIKDLSGKTEYDITIYSIVKYFQLCMDNNPNMVDSLFTPRNCVLHSTPIGEMVRENRREFLHKGSFHKLKGYAYSQLNKIKGKKNRSNPNRAKSIEDHGYDVKFAYHIVRLMLQAEQILMEGDLDLQRSREQLKSIRRGDWSLEDITDFFESKEKALETLYVKSDLRAYPDEKLIKQLLMDCLEMHYGSLTSTISREVDVDTLLVEMQSVLDKYTHQ